MTRIDVAPDLIEEALFQALDRRASEWPDHAHDWRRERELAYAAHTPAERERAFRTLAADWFARLDLVAPIRRALAWCPSAARSLALVHLRKATRIRDEGSELYAPPAMHHGEDVGARLVLTLRPESVADAGILHPLALRELLHADDMLDPAFDYRPVLLTEPDADRARAELIRDRFSVLWSARVEGRAARLQGHGEPPEPTPAFRRAFGADADADEIACLCEAAWSGRLATQRDLVERACAGCSSSHVALR